MCPNKEPWPGRWWAGVDPHPLAHPSFLLPRWFFHLESLT